ANLYKIKYLNIVTGTLSCTDPKKDKDNSCLFAKLNKDTYVEILQHLSPDILAYFSSTIPTKDRFNRYKLWKLLKANFADNDITSKTTALEKLLAFK
ncbi:hypothetical protein VP01_8020g2, partial [Puccinia sorghi]